MAPERPEPLAARLDVWQRDMCLAEKVQTVLQNTVPPAVPGVALAGASLPARTLGGDYYDFLLLENRVRVLIADVMGKGVSAALQMVMTRMAARLAARRIAEPAEFLTELNADLYPDLRRLGSFLTMFCADYHLTDYTLTCANAGHPYPLLRRSHTTQVQALPVRGIAIGAIARPQYQTLTVGLGPGDTILFYTDGALDLTDPAGRQLNKGLANLFLNHRRMNVERLRDKLLAGLREFAAGEPQRDDLTLALLQVDRRRQALQP